ncbi:predicted protein [Chaetomium globosum CBS 148.51]|uniref:Amidoligase enzyme n=1 Tax=Chaetomium globosum (strain ATCC 6205 / CBS 148.51 / DSM 1962 / NBRC 6347 / NRRL 1970) TaxID=306901 RepID=Q2GW43_CHAGB|nr:uncharacterized protein CHGG_07811 [Chaetomium globosum CBS 148.51]EAQ86558.1 predicted protein [Chaetomium globosum CBS 148.51]
MSRNIARSAPPSAGPRPLFGVEIEIFVRLLPHVENAIDEASLRDPRSLPSYWRDWDPTLPNNSRDLGAKQDQRECVGAAIKAIIDAALGPRNGWKCESDASLKEYKLTEPPHLRKWWGIEIISPPMSSNKQWQTEIKTIFDVVGESFDFWTNENCACHVHVSPGPTKNSTYSLTDLNQMAKGAFFWEDALCDLLPPERRVNRYADPNYTYFCHQEYLDVPRDGWAPIFHELDAVTSQGQDTFLYHMRGGANQTRYISTSFDPFTKYGTVELRRQAGAASALTVIHRVLLALTLHVSSMNYNFSAAARRRDYPHGDELIRELSRCIKLLPETCLGSRFQNWLRFCQESYEDGQAFPEKGINKQERNLRNGGDVPTAGRGGGGGGGGGTASPARGPSRQSAGRPTRRDAGPPGGWPGDSPTSAPRPLARQGTRMSRDDSPPRRPLARRTRDPSRPPAARAQSRAPAARASSPPRARVRHVPARDESPPRRPLARTRTSRVPPAESSGRRPLRGAGPRRATTATRRYD